MKIFIQLALLAVLIPTLCQGEEGASGQHKDKQSGVAMLSPGLRKLFTREMVELQNGMTALTPLYISGDFGGIAAIARQMESSYVLKQSLSESQVHELHSKLPEEFLALDQQFHYLAGMLEHVAKLKKIELVGFYISKMGEACVSCHARYAAQRFPALAPARQDAHHH